MPPMYIETMQVETIPMPIETPQTPKRGRGRPRTIDPNITMAEYMKAYREEHKEHIKEGRDARREEINKRAKARYAATHDVQPKVQCTYIGKVAGRCQKMCRPGPVCHVHTGKRYR